MWLYLAVAVLTFSTVYLGVSYYHEKQINASLRQTITSLEQKVSDHGTSSGTVRRINQDRVANLERLNAQLNRNEANLRQRLGRAEAARLAQAVRQPAPVQVDVEDVSDNEMPGP